MRKSVKAALLSGLVFPGAGQLWLKCYLRGASLIVLVMVCLAVIVQKASQQAYQILEKMESQTGAVDMVALLQSASKAPDDLMTTSASTILVICWLIGMVDAYIAGRKKDRAILQRRGESSRMVDNQAKED